MKMIKRALSTVVDNASKTFKCVLLAGPRQVGKTTLLRSIAAKERREVTLDDPTVRALAQRDPELFLATYPVPLLIDEVQYAPNLFPFIKMRVDRSAETGQYWLTGSQPFRLMKGVSESLAGRVAILNLQGLSEAERYGREIDLLLQSAMRIHPIEIKSSSNPNEDEIRSNFSALARTGTKLSTGAVLCLAGENVPLAADLVRVNAGTV